MTNEDLAVLKNAQGILRIYGFAAPAAQLAEIVNDPRSRSLLPRDELRRLEDAHE